MRHLVIVVLSLFLAGALVAAVAVGPADAAVMHVVRPGDTLYQISLRYDVSVDAIAAVNKLGNPSQIVPGQVLTIPKAGPGTLRLAPLAQDAARDPSTGSGRSQGPETTRAQARTRPVVIAVHRVRPGDSLSAIADRYRVAVDAIKQANGLWSDVIHPGQRLSIPARGSAAALARRHMPAPQPIPVPRVAFQRTAREGSRGARIVQDAMRYLGVPYLWGGASTRGIDCSGFIYQVFSRYVRSLGRARSYDYFRAGTPVAPQALLPGDLVFFTTDDPGPSHVGIFVGDGKFIHASSTAGAVTVTSLDDAFYGARFLGVRRLVTP